MNRGLRIGSGSKLGGLGAFGIKGGGVSDTIPPTVTITSSETSPTAAATIPITFTWSEVVTGFAVGDITISGGSLGSFAGSGASYTVTWTPPAGGGTLTMDIAQGVCVDGAGNGNTAASQFSIVVYGAETTTTLQPDATAGVDCTIFEEAATTNYPTLTSLYVGDIAAGATAAAARTLIKFDISSIPSTAYVVSAKLSLYENSANDTAGIGTHAINVHRLLKNWVENQATWNIYSTGNNWGAAGAKSDGVDKVATPSSSVNFDATPASAFVDFTGLGADVQGFLNGSLNNYGWILVAPAAEDTASTSYNEFLSSDNASNRPKLVVVHRDLP